MEKQITLTADTFKALAGEKRVQILKELGQRRKTQSEIAQKLGLSAPTVAEHLSLLEKAGLVHAIDEGRKWKYFALTEKGKEILNPGETRILVLLGTSFIGFLGMVSVVLYRYGFFGGTGTLATAGNTVYGAASPQLKTVLETTAQANQQTLQEGIATAIQNALQQAPTTLKTTVESSAAPALGQGIQDLNRQLISHNTIEQIASQASQEILPKLATAPAALPLEPAAKTVSLISTSELTMLVFFALLFGLMVGYYLRHRKRVTGP